MHISIPPQGATGRQRRLQDVAKCLSCSKSTVLSRILNDQSMPSMDNKAAIVIHGHCSVAVSKVDLEVTLLLRDYSCNIQLVSIFHSHYVISL